MSAKLWYSCIFQFFSPLTICASAKLVPGPKNDAYYARLLSTSEGKFEFLVLAPLITKLSPLLGIIKCISAELLHKLFLDHLLGYSSHSIAHVPETAFDLGQH